MSHAASELNDLVLQGLRPADDLPHPPSSEPDWSENYLSHAVFPDAGASHWLHHGRTAWDREQWQEIFTFYLPGDRYLVAKAAASNPDESGPRGAGLTYRCDEPFTRWTKTYRGGARMLSGDELRAGAMADGASVGVEMELEWRATGPAFTMDTSRQSWTDAHYEQHCDITGLIAFGDEELALTGMGLRDHSWGPRDWSPIGRHCWIHARWADGRSFMIFHLISADGSHTLSHVGVDLGAGAGMEPAAFTSEPPLIDSLDAGLGGFGLELRTESGHLVTIGAEVEQAGTLSMIGKSEIGIGACADASHWLSEAQTRFTWDGDIAHGLTERTVDRRGAPA
jgi:hypothetical protein